MPALAPPAPPLDKATLPQLRSWAGGGGGSEFFPVPWGAGGGGGAGWCWGPAGDATQATKAP